MSGAVSTGTDERLAEALLALLSHDLRSPLGPVVLATSAIEDDEYAGSDARELAAMAGTHAARAVRLVDAVLAATRGPRPGTLEPVHLWPVLADAASRYRELGGRARIEGSEATVLADREQVRDAVLDLIEVAAADGGDAILTTTIDGGRVRVVIQGSDPAGCAAGMAADLPTDWRAAFALGAKALVHANGGSAVASDGDILIELGAAP